MNSLQRDAQQLEAISRARVQVFFVYCAALLVAVLVALGCQSLGDLWMLALADVAATVFVFGCSVWFRNSSLYDPYWSVAPVPIALYLTFSSGGLSLRAALVLGLLFWWAARLTWNWLRRWQGASHEDWRYQSIKEKTGRFYWLVNLLGIHMMPTVLVFLGCLPLFSALDARHQGLSLFDLVAFSVTALAIWLEARADKELIRFLRSDPAPEAFLESGVWSLCRHPNYLGEVLFWWGLFLFGVAAEPSAWRVIVGPLSMTLLFVFISVPLMDKRMLSRKPSYERVMRARFGLLPIPKARD